MKDADKLHMETKSAFAMLMAVLAQVTLVLGISWNGLALLGAGHLLAQVPPSAVLLAAAACFAFGLLVMRNRRPLLVLITADLLLTAGSVLGLGRIFSLKEAAAADGFGSSWAAAVSVIMGAGILLGLLFQLKWTAGRFADQTMVLQLQVLLVSGALQIWMADQLGLKADWAMPTFLMAAGLLAGLTAAKTSGLRSGGGGKGTGLAARTGPAAAVLIFCTLVAGGAAAFAEPVGQAVSRGYQMVEGILLAGVNLIGNIMKFLFLRNRVRLDAGTSASESGSGEGMEYLPTEEHDMEFFRVIFHIICILLILFVVFSIIRLLLQVTVGRGISLARKRSSRIQQDGTLWEQLLAAVKELRQRIRARRLLAKHPSSVAALVVWLEERTRSSEALRRQSGETLRSFLLRLADFAENQDAEILSGRQTAAALFSLADAADRACYSPDGGLLDDFEESGLVREYFAKRGQRT